MLSILSVPSRFIFFALFLMAGAAILYELLLAAVLSYLLGAAVLYFSLTVGIFLFALGAGAWFSRRLEENLLRKFLSIEIVLGALGGLAVPLIFFLYVWIFRYFDRLILQNPLYFFGAAPYYEMFFTAAGFAVIFVIGVLVGIELPVFSRLVSAYWPLKEALARSFFGDYLGSIAGAVLFPLFLLPRLGFLRTGFLAGFLNIAAAFVLARAISGRGFIKEFSPSAKILALAASALLVLGFAKTPELEEFFTRKIFAGGEVMLVRRSPYQQIELVKDGKERLALFLNGQWQFQSGLLEKRYHETFAHPVMSFLGGKARRVLILGGGDGLLLREIFKYSNIETVTLVDIDPVMTGLATTNPSLVALNAHSMSDQRLALINDDAFRWLLYRSPADSKFDAAFVDFPDPSDDALSRLYSMEFYLLLLRNISGNGLAVIQAGTLPSPTHEIIKRTLWDSGFYAVSLHPAGGGLAMKSGKNFEASFLVAAKSEKIIRGFHSYLRGGDSAGMLAPYSAEEIKELAVVPNSLFRPVGFGHSLGLVPRFLQIKSVSGDFPPPPLSSAPLSR